MTNEQIFIQGIGISNYKSFGTLQRVGSFKKINLFAGQNNSGKSNILSFIGTKYSGLLKLVQSNPKGIVNISKQIQFEVVDFHRDKNNNSRQQRFFEFCALIENQELHDFIHSKNATGKPDAFNNSERAIRVMKRVFSEFPEKTSPFWIRYCIDENQTIKFDIPDIQMVKSVLDERNWNALWVYLTGRMGGELAGWISGILNTLNPIQQLPSVDVDIIPAIRKVGDSEVIQSDYSGLGLIDSLAKLQNPDYESREDKHRFEKIISFVREVVGDESASIEIPHNRKRIIVHMNDKELPLSSLGTGIQELIIIASAATVLTNQVLCIEEPELHLHPTLQRKLIRYLQEKTSNQYFITTHSTHLLDMQDIAVFHVYLKDGETRVESAYSDVKKSKICVDLGYRASDIMQANCIVWVEGPSDRIYLNHWLSHLYPELIEGLHYSIMFYGGRLLSHLSANDEEVQDFISLRKLNRNISILIDSDKSNSRSQINKTKRRIKEEFNNGPGFAWVTEGREIENYIHPATLEEATKLVYPKARSLVTSEKFEHVLAYKMLNGQIKNNLDKVKIARRVATLPVKIEQWDLMERLKQLGQFIYDSNSE